VYQTPQQQRHEVALHSFDPYRASMINPFEITLKNPTISQLEEFILNAVAFAGKNAQQQSRKMHVFLFEDEEGSPFAKIRSWHMDDTLAARLMKHKLGKYTLLTRSFSQLALSGINLQTCSIEELQKFPGIKSKTSRFFVLHSRPNQELAVIDTHVLKELRRLGFTELRYTPTEKKYAELEKIFIKHLKENSICDFAAYDLNIWKTYTKNKA
jgi:hypothetical protein